jgi:hypothetical protein
MKSRCESAWRYRGGWRGWLWRGSEAAASANCGNVLGSVSAMEKITYSHAPCPHCVEGFRGNLEHDP